MTTEPKWTRRATLEIKGIALIIVIYCVFSQLLDGVVQIMERM
jgi:hypothetical protein